MNRLTARSAGQRARIDQSSLGRDSSLHDGNLNRFHVIGLNHDLDRQIEFASKLEITLIMCGNCHNGARAVGHQHVIGNPDRDLFARDRVNGITAREDARLFFVGRFALNIRLAQSLGLIGHYFFFLSRSSQFFHQRMLRGQYHKGHPPQSIGAGSEYFQLIPLLGAELDQRTFGFTDPVGLQHAYTRRPIDRIVIQQFFGIIGDLEEPLFQILLDNRRTTTLAVAVIPPDLFARQSGIAIRAPIHRRHFAISQTVFVKLFEEKLRPAIIFFVRRNDLAAPIKHGTHAFQLSAHAINIGIGPGTRMNVALDRRIFRRQAKGVEANWEHHVEPIHAFVTSAGIGGSHCVPVANVEIP